MNLLRAGWSPDFPVPQCMLLDRTHWETTFQHDCADAVKPKGPSTVTRAVCCPSIISEDTFRSGFFREWQRPALKLWERTLPPASPMPTCRLRKSILPSEPGHPLSDWKSLGPRPFISLFLSIPYRPKRQRLGSGKKRRPIPIGKLYQQKFEKREVWIDCGILNNL